MFGLDPAGGELATLIPDPSRLWAAVEGLAPGATVAPIPLEGRRANGVPFALDASVQRARRTAGCCACCASSTARRRARSTRPSTRCRSGWRCSTPTASTCASTARCARCSAAREHELIGIRDRCSRIPTTARATSTPPGAILRGELSTWQCEKRFVRPDGSDRLDAGQPDLPARRVRPPAVLGRAVPGRHRAAPDGVARPADRRAQPARVRRRARARGRLGRARGAARARPRRLQGHQRRPRPPRGRRAAARRPPTRSAGACAATTRWRGSAATSSPCCCRTATSSARRWSRNELAALIAGQRFRFDGVERSVTASVGVAAVDSPADALSAADRAMYAAKAVGGGRVRVAILKLGMPQFVAWLS